MTDTLDRIIYGQSTAEDSSLAFSGDLTPEDAAAWRSLITLTPCPETVDRAWQPVGIFAGPSRNFLLATANQDMVETVLIPRKLLQQAAGNVDPLLSLLKETTEDTAFAPGEALSKLDVPVLLPWRFEDRLKLFQQLLHDYAGGEIDAVLALLGAALHERRLLITHFTGETRARVALVQGLMALLPAQARAELTFATYVNGTGISSARVIFSDETSASERWTADIEAGQFPDDAALLQIPYVALLREQWQGDEMAFIHFLADLEPVAEVLLPGEELLDGLNQLAEQVRLNERVRREEAVDPASLKAVLTSNVPLPPDLNLRYSELLLEHALNTRDNEAALLVALRMDEDPEVDAALGKALTGYLDTQPDDVYFFVRTRLNDAMEADPVWIERLQAAGLVALRVAISDADSETIMNWLRLIAREPSSYGLAGILREGVIASQARARSDGNLARFLITLAIKHVPDTLDTLLEDSSLLAVIPNNLGLVLREHAGDPLHTLNNRGPELFLVAMARSARVQAAAVFSPDVIDQVWNIYSSGQTFNLPEHYLPGSVVEELTSTGALWLAEDSLDHLTTLMLADGRDDLFLMFADRLAEHGILLPLLSRVLHNSQRSVEDMMTVIGQLMAAGTIEHQAVVNVYVELLNLREWRQTALPFVEQIARLIQQHPTLDVEPEIIWRLLDVAMAARSELVARVGAQQVFSDIEEMDAAEESAADMDARLIETLLRLHDSLQWSQQARNHLLKWWRGFVHQQSLARLVRLDKAMESKKSLADCRSIVQTSLAFRRMLGNRTMAEFADAINVVYSVLEDISESFDPSPKQSTRFDMETMRAELDAMRDDISDQQWRILAKNFKELAALIGLMGDQRSRGSLVRQNVDRQLLAGEQQPESAVDAMKWMAGYLDGIQDRNTEDSE